MILVPSKVVPGTLIWYYEQNLGEEIYYFVLETAKGSTSQEPDVNVMRAMILPSGRVITFSFDGYTEFHEWGMQLPE